MFIGIRMRARPSSFHVPNLRTESPAGSVATSRGPADAQIGQYLRRVSRKYLHCSGSTEPSNACFRCGAPREPSPVAWVAFTARHCPHNHFYSTSTLSVDINVALAICFQFSRSTNIGALGWVGAVGSGSMIAKTSRHNGVRQRRFAKSVIAAVPVLARFFRTMRRRCIANRHTRERCSVQR